MVGGKAGIQAGKKVENRKQCKQEGRKEEKIARQRIGKNQIWKEIRKESRKIDKQSAEQVDKQKNTK